MQGRRMEVPFEDFYLPIWRLAAVNPGIENRRQGFAQLDRRCNHPLPILCADGAAKFPCLLCRQQLQLSGEAEKFRIRGQPILWFCREPQVKSVDEFQGRVARKQFERLGKGNTHTPEYNP